jgi:poly-D-alanine transfer protein DltD
VESPTDNTTEENILRKKRMREAEEQVCIPSFFTTETKSETKVERSRKKIKAQTPVMETVPSIPKKVEKLLNKNTRKKVTKETKSKPITKPNKDNWDEIDELFGF